MLCCANSHARGPRHELPLRGPWADYLQTHFYPPDLMREQRPAPSAMAVPLGRHHPPSHVLLAHGAANDWLPAPGVSPAPGLNTMRKLVAKHLHKLNVYMYVLVTIM